MCFTEGALSRCEVLALETRCATPVFLMGQCRAMDGNTGQWSAVQRAPLIARAAAPGRSLHSFQPAFGAAFPHAHKHNPREAPPADKARSPQSAAGRLRQRDGRELRAGLPRPAPLRSAPLHRLPGPLRGGSGSAAPGRCLEAGWDRGGAVRAAVLGGSSRDAQDGGGSRRESLRAERGRSAGRVPANKSVTVISSALFGPERKAQ